MKYKVFVADDHHLLRHGVVSIIQAENNYTVVGEADDGLAAFNMICETLPDIAVLDIQMPNMTGLEIARECKKKELKTEFILLTMHKEEAFLNEAMEIGAKGYMLKENTTSDLVVAMNLAIKGDTFISPILTECIKEIKLKKEKMINDAQGFNQLTKTELQVMKYISKNKTSREIAEDMYTSIRTVQNHRANICLKLGIRGANKLLQYSMENRNLL